ncbi:MAG: phage tail tape measure protein [Oscillospiraceae bacterium]|nr:phage tail tape measure protein [Oscillospiraceae bacterium]
MATDSSQIQLVVGVDQSASLKNFKDGVNALIAEVNKDPPKIKVEIDTGSAKSIKSQIDSALKTASSGGTSLGTQFKSATTEVQKLVSTLGSLDDKSLGQLTSTLSSFENISADGAKQLVAALSNVSGKVTDVTAKVRTLADGERQLDSVTVKAVDDFGNIVTQTSKWNAKTKEVSSTLETVHAKMDATAKAQETATAATSKNTNTTQQNVAVEKSYISVLSNCNSFLERYTAAKNSHNSSSRAAYTTVEQEKSAMEAAYSAYKTGALSLEAFKNAINNTSVKIRENTVLLKANGDATKTLVGRVSDLAAKFSSWFSAYTIVINMMKAMKSLASASVEIEDAMAQIQIVTGATDSQLTKFLSEAIDLAKELGQSVTDVASAIETFSRLGYSFDEASELAEYATILANVADTDVDTATTGLTSIIKGYSLEASDAEHIADVLVTVGQEYAISAEELMEAFERGGAALAATGATVEQSAGLFAATNAALQDASTTGTMWKTNYCLCV